MVGTRFKVWLIVTSIVLLFLAVFTYFADLVLGSEVAGLLLALADLVTAFLTTDFTLGGMI